MKDQPRFLSSSVCSYLCVLSVVLTLFTIAAAAQQIPIVTGGGPTGGFPPTLQEYIS